MNSFGVIRKASLVGGMVFAGVLLGGGLMGATAYACSYDVCSTSNEYLPQSGKVVPANARGMFAEVWNAQLSEEGMLERTGEELESGEEIRLAGEEIYHLTSYLYELELEEGFEFEAGKSYRVGGGIACSPGDEIKEVEFEVGEAAPLPTTLGTLRVGEEYQGLSSPDEPRGSTSCGVNAEVVRVPVRLELSEEAQPWKDLFYYEIFVNGEERSQPMSEGSGMGMRVLNRGEARIQTGCENDSGLGEGTHLVEFLGYLPGVEEPLVSESAEVTLECGPFSGGCSCSTTAGENQVPVEFLLVVVMGVVWGVRRRVVG